MAAVRPSTATIFTAVPFLAVLFLLDVSASGTPSDSAALTLPTSAVKANNESTLQKPEARSSDLITVGSVPLTANDTASSNGEESKDVDPVSSATSIKLPHHHHHRFQKDDDAEGFSEHFLERNHKYAKEKVKKHFKHKDRDVNSDDESDDEGDDHDGEKEEKKKKEKKKRDIGRKEAEGGFEKRDLKSAA